MTQQLEPAELPQSAGVVVIGAGVSGCSIARELTRYTPDVVILEKESDAADGTTKANNAEVHSGIGEQSGTLKQKLNVRGNRLYDQFVEGLGVDFVRQGLLIVVTRRSLPDRDTQRMPRFLLNFLLEKVLPRLIVLSGKKKGIEGLRIVSRDEIFRMEPHVTKNAVAGVFDRTYGMVAPYKLTIALAEHAVINGARVFLNTEVTGIKVKDGGVKAVVTDHGEIQTPIVVNAAGLYADEVADMAGAGGFKIHPRKGASLLFDRQETEEFVNSSVSEFRWRAHAKTKGGGAMPTLEGNLQLGPTAIEVEDKRDTSISAEEIDEIFERFYYLLPDFPRASIISAFSGLRAPTEEEDFIIEASDETRGFVNVAGIQSPGLASAPAIAEMVVGILHDLGVPRSLREDFDPVRPAPPRFAELSDSERDRLIAEDPRYGNVVCRCEYVTEAEVVRAVHGIVPATNMDAVKRRTRVGMGRCQGGFCGCRSAQIIARELGIPVTDVTKDGEGGWVFAGHTKTPRASGSGLDEAGA
jgi:glycerol-3-phosphate dehydrogenase